MTTLRGLIEKTEALRAEMRASGKAALEEALAGFFAKHPAAESIVWAQYAPHFNDGDACTFHVREPELKLDREQVAEDIAAKAREYYSDDDAGDWHGGDCSDEDAIAKVCGLGYYKGQGREATADELSLYNDAVELLSDISNSEDVLESVFGDSVKVTCTRDGIEVDEYNHD